MKDQMTGWTEPFLTSKEYASILNELLNESVNPMVTKNVSNEHLNYITLLSKGLL